MVASVLINVIFLFSAKVKKAKYLDNYLDIGILGPYESSFRVFDAYDYSALGKSGFYPVFILLSVVVPANSVTYSTDIFLHSFREYMEFFAPVFNLIGLESHVRGMICVSKVCFLKSIY